MVLTNNQFGSDYDCCSTAADFGEHLRVIWWKAVKGCSFIMKLKLGADVDCFEQYLKSVFFTLGNTVDKRGKISSQCATSITEYLITSYVTDFAIVFQDCCSFN